MRRQCHHAEDGGLSIKDRKQKSLRQRRDVLGTWGCGTASEGRMESQGLKTKGILRGVVLGAAALLMKEWAVLKIMSSLVKEGRSA